MPLQLPKRRRLEIEPSVVGCGTVKQHKCRAPLTHYAVVAMSCSGDILAQTHLRWV